MNKALVILAIVFICGCAPGRQEQVISDVARPCVIMLEKRAGQGNVYSVSIRVEGHIEGIAELSLNENGRSYRSERLSGKVDLNLNGDWYTNSAELKYRPVSVRKGVLRITYDFHSL